MPEGQVSSSHLHYNGGNEENQVNMLNFKYSERKIRLLIKLEHSAL